MSPYRLLFASVIVVASTIRLISIWPPYLRNSNEPSGPIPAHPVVFAWDTAAVVYVTAGMDLQPGVANVDDDGSGVVDDAAELGATGSDDKVLTPLDKEYAAATIGSVRTSPLSRGAMRPFKDVASPSTQYRYDWVDASDRFRSRIVDR